MATNITYPFDCYMALMVAGTEVGGIGYERRPAHFEDIGDGRIAANTSSVQWPACGSDWGPIDAVTLFDALTGGHLLCIEAATSVVQGNMYDQLRVSASGYQVVHSPSVPMGFGTFTWGTGRFATSRHLVPPGSNIGSPYDVGGYGVGPYETLEQTVLLLRTLGTVALCGNQPGAWTPPPPCETGVWAPSDACKAGSWAPGPFDVVPVS